MADKALRPDPAQIAALAPLQLFLDQLIAESKPPRGFWKRWTKTKPPNGSSGLYLYGEVGRGKSLLMDLFFSHAPQPKKRRVHFHAFMLEVHERLHRAQRNTHEADGILPRLAHAIAQETTLLCFDEFHVGNIADAMILGRLFDALFQEGVRVVATSNWPPALLYKNGLQRDRFLPFIALLQERLTVYELTGAVDHRYDDAPETDGIFWPLGPDTTTKLHGIFCHRTKNAPPESLELPVQGRLLRVRQSAHGVAFFTFEELCGLPLGAADFLAIAECFHTVILDQIPELTAEKRNEATRFIILVDVLYEAKTKFFMGCAKPPEELCPSQDNTFAYQRTLSRLMEMQTETYRAKPHLSAD